MTSVTFSVLGFKVYFLLYTLTEAVLEDECFKCLYPKINILM